MDIRSPKVKVTWILNEDVQIANNKRQIERERERERENEISSGLTTRGGRRLSLSRSCYRLIES